MGRPSRTAIQAEEVRARILEAARALFRTEGMKAVTLRRVADSCGYSPAALYRYYANRTALVRAMWADALETLGRETSEAQHATLDPVERVRGFLLAYAGFAERHPSAFETTFLTIWSPDPERLVVADPLRTTAYGRLREGVSQAVAEHRFMTCDVDLLAQTLWAAVHGACALQFNFGDFPLEQRSRRIEAAVHAAIRGVSNP